MSKKKKNKKNNNNNTVVEEKLDLEEEKKVIDDEVKNLINVEELIETSQKNNEDVVENSEPMVEPVVEEVVETAGEDGDQVVEPMIEDGAELDVQENDPVVEELRENIESVVDEAALQNETVDNVEKKDDVSLNKLNKKLNFIIIFNILATAVVLALLFLNNTGAVVDNGPVSNVDNNTNNSVDVVNPVISETKVERFRNLYLANKARAAVQGDFVGQIIFESEIISEPVVQGKTNETYLRRDYETNEYSIGGTVFLDSDCDVSNDQNFMIYGHNATEDYDPTGLFAFTPLHLLEKQENYEENKIIYFVLEDRICVYQVVSVFYIKVDEADGVQYLIDGEPLYYLNNYTEEQLATYIGAYSSREKYDTGLEITGEDKLLTLQTCKEGSLDKLIVLAKQIDLYNFE